MMKAIAALSFALLAIVGMPAARGASLPPTRRLRGSADPTPAERSLAEFTFPTGVRASASCMRDTSNTAVHTRSLSRR
jgi:hypothetical protein